ncbi:MAG: hypothetical protein H0W83_05560 [Planctomycetes bacterium]|nr:hypothetical protein [Planctomycetota bacterium]
MEYADSARIGVAGANGSHRMKQALAVCRINVNPIELWQLEDKEYTIRVAGKESAGSQPAAGENVWIDVALPQFTDAEAKAKVKAWTLNWSGMEPHCFYLNQGSGGFVKQSNQGKIAVDDAKARFLGGMPGDSTMQQNAAFGAYYCTLSGQELTDLGIGPVSGLVTIKQRRMEVELGVDGDFKKAPYAGTTLYGNKGTVRIIDDGPQTVIQPTSGLTGANSQFSIAYDASLAFSDGVNAPVSGDGASQCAPILSWNDGSSFLVAGERPGDTILQVFPVFGTADTSNPIMEIPVQVDLPVLSEPGLDQIQVARGNLQKRQDFLSNPDSTLVQDPTPIPPAGGGEDANWKLPDSYRAQFGVSDHPHSTTNTRELDSVFEFCMYMLAEIMPATNPGPMKWYAPVSGGTSIFQIPAEQADLTAPAVELSRDQYWKIWNSGGNLGTEEQAAETWRNRIRASGPPLQHWLRFLRHVMADGSFQNRSDPDIEKQRQLLEVKAKAYMDQAALARMKRYFSLRADYRAGVSPFALSPTANEDLGYVYPPLQHAGGDDATVQIAVGFFQNLWDSIVHNSPLTRLFATQITPNWFVGHSFTEEVLHHMMAERLSWAKKLLATIPQQSGTATYPITVQMVPTTLTISTLNEGIAGIPLELVFGSDGSLAFKIPDAYRYTDGNGNVTLWRNSQQLGVYFKLGTLTGGQIDLSTSNQLNNAGFRMPVYNFDGSLRYVEIRGATPEAGLIVRLMQETYALQGMASNIAAQAFWQNFARNSPRAFFIYCVGDFVAGTGDIYRVLWGQDVVTGEQLSIEDRLLSGMMVGVTVLTGGVPGSMIAGRGVAFLRQGLSRDLMTTARSSMSAVDGQITRAVDDIAQGGQDIGQAASTLRRAAGTRELTRDALVQGLRRATTILDLPVQDFLKAHCGLGRMGNKIAVKSGSGAPHISPVCSLEKSAKRPIPLPSAIRGSGRGSAKDAQTLVNTGDDAAFVQRVINAERGTLSDADVAALVERCQANAGCFIAGTPVLMASGEWKPIEKIVVGDVVATRDQWSPDSARMVRQVTALERHEVEAIEHLRLADSDTVYEVDCTGAHPFWVEGEGWTMAKDMNVGDHIDGGDHELTLAGRTVTSGATTVYNFEVLETRTYFVRGFAISGVTTAVWVHNNCAVRDAIEQYIRRQAADLGVTLTDKEALDGLKNLKQVVEKHGNRFYDAGRTFPFGFTSLDQYKAFSLELRKGLEKAGHKDAEPIFQGSSVTGVNFEKGIPFDSQYISDFDIAIVSPSLMKRAKELGVKLRPDGKRRGPLSLEFSQATLEKLGLKSMISDLTRAAGREVNIMVYDSPTFAITKQPSMLVPR